MENEPANSSKGDRLASGSVFIFGSIVAARIATILSSIVIVRVLGPKDYGVLSIIILTISLAAITASFQIPSALVKFLAAAHADKTQDANRLLGAAFLMTLVSTVITVTVLAMLSPVLALNLYHEPRVQGLLLVALVSLVLSALTSPLFSVFQAFERIKELGVRSAVAALLTIPSTLLLVLLFGLEGAVVAMVVNAGISILVNVALLRAIWRARNLKLEMPREGHVYRRLLGYATPAFANATMVSVLLWFCGTQFAAREWYLELGRYSAGYGLASYVLFITSAVGVPLIPIVSKLDRHNPEQMSHFMARTIRVGSLLTLLPTLVFVAMPEPFLRILYGNSYVGASNVVRLVAPAVFLASVTGLVGYGLAGTGQMKSAFALNLTWVIPVAILSVLLIPTWRENGLALAILAAYVIHFSATLVFAKMAWSVALSRLTAPMLIAFISLPTAAFISFYSSAPRLVLSSILLSGVIIAGLLVLTNRELEVLSQPLRKVFSRIHARH